MPPEQVNVGGKSGQGHRPPENTPRVVTAPPLPQSATTNSVKHDPAIRITALDVPSRKWFPPVAVGRCTPGTGKALRRRCLCPGRPSCAWWWRDGSHCRPPQMWSKLPLNLLSLLYDGVLLNPALSLAPQFGGLSSCLRASVRGLPRNLSGSGPLPLLLHSQDQFLFWGPQ